MRISLFGLSWLAMLSVCATITEQAEKENVLARRLVAEKRMKEREARYNFAEASDDFQRYHPRAVDPRSVKCMYLLEKTVVPRGTSPPRRRMEAVSELPEEIAEMARCMALWSHICAAVNLPEDSE